MLGLILACIVGLSDGVKAILDFIWKGITSVGDFAIIVMKFFNKVLSPVLNFLPSVWGSTVGTLLTVVLIVYVAISIWETVN